MDSIPPASSKPDLQQSPSPPQESDDEQPRTAGSRTVAPAPSQSILKKNGAKPQSPASPRTVHFKKGLPTSKEFENEMPAGQESVDLDKEIKIMVDWLIKGTSEHLALFTRQLHSSLKEKGPMVLVKLASTVSGKVDSLNHKAALLFLKTYLSEKIDDAVTVATDGIMQASDEFYVSLFLGELSQIKVEEFTSLPVEEAKDSLALEIADAYGLKPTESWRSLPGIEKNEELKRLKQASTDRKENHLKTRFAEHRETMAMEDQDISDKAQAEAKARFSDFHAYLTLQVANYVQEAIEESMTEDPEMEMPDIDFSNLAEMLQYMSDVSEEVHKIACDFVKDNNITPIKDEIPRALALLVLLRTK